MSSLARAGALVAAGTLVTTGLVSGLTTPAVAASNDPRPVTIGADWLAGQLTNGLIHNDQYDFDDLGLTIDAGLALDEVGGHGATVGDIAAALGPRVKDNYAQGDEYAFTAPYAFVQRGYYAGATAKALVFAQATGQNTGTWAGFDLVSALEDRVIGSGSSTGRIADDSSYGDYANVIGEAYAARGLAQASSSKAADVMQYLLEQQCSDGYFRLDFTTDKSAADQTCNGGIASGDSAPDTDVTAVATLMIDRSGVDTKAVGLAIARAESWLLAAQRADGSFGGGPSTEESNTNSTGLAGWVLGELGHPAAAGKAAAWVRAHQADEVADCPSALIGATGAIAYDGAGLAGGRSAGITAKSSDQWRRATTQALPVLAYAAPAAGPLSVSAPSGFVAAGSTVSFGIAGLAPGQTGCVRGVDAAHPIAAGAAGSAVDHVVMPAGTATRTITVSDRDGASATAQVSVLGAARLTVLPGKSRVHRRAKVRVVVQGLAPGEKVDLRLRGVIVKVGRADAAGRFVRAVRVGKKLGKARIVARGQFPALRNGHAVIRVVR